MIPRLVKAGLRAVNELHSKASYTNEHLLKDQHPNSLPCEGEGRGGEIHTTRAHNEQ